MNRSCQHSSLCKFRFSLLSGLAMLIAAAATVAITPATSIAQDHIAWLHDLEQAKTTAAREKKLVLLHFTASWCAPCKEIERFVFVNPMAIRAIGGQVVPVKVDVDLNKDIAEQYNVSSVPYDVVITPAGHVVSERSSPRSSDGYLQLIEQSKSMAQNISGKTAEKVAELKSEMQRQKQEFAASQNKPQSFGALAQGSTNQFKPRGDLQNGIPVPEFKGPQPWSTGENVSGTDSTKLLAQTLGNRDGQFRPATPAASGVTPPNMPKITTPNAPQTPMTSVGGGGFAAVPGMSAANSSGQSPAFNPSSGQTMASQTSTNSGPAKITNQFQRTASTEKAEPVRIVNEMYQQKAKTDIAATEVKTSMETAASAITPPLGLDGYCGVSLIENQKWVKGEKKWGCVHRGRLYFFASEANRDQFRVSPDVYSPLLGGADPVEFHSSGSLVQGARKHGVFYGDDGAKSVIVLLSNQANRDKFEAEPAEYLRTVRQAMSRLDSDLLMR